MHTRPPLLSCRSFSFHANPRFIPMKLSTPSRDIRFQPVSIGLYIKSIFRGNSCVAFTNGHFITTILLGTRHYDVDTTFRGDWIVIDCRIILERWNRYSEIGEDACIYLLWKFNLKRACILRWFTSRWVCVSIRVNMCHARVNASGVWHVRRIGILNENSFWLNCTWQTTFGSNRIWSTWNK